MPDPGAGGGQAGAAAAGEEPSPRVGDTLGGAGLGHSMAPGLVVASPGRRNQLRSGSDPSIAFSMPIPHCVPSPERLFFHEFPL